jgi:membrane protein YdbS with pleckstrin-like domain
MLSEVKDPWISLGVPKTPSEYLSPKLKTSTSPSPNPEKPLTIIRILVGLIQAILKVAVDAFVAGGTLIVSALVVIALAVAAIWLITLFAISLFRRTRSH